MGIVSSINEGVKQQILLSKLLNVFRRNLSGNDKFIQWFFIDLKEEIEKEIDQSNYVFSSLNIVSVLFTIRQCFSMLESGDAYTISFDPNKMGFEYFRVDWDYGPETLPFSNFVYGRDFYLYLHKVRSPDKKPLAKRDFLLIDKDTLSIKCIMPDNNVLNTSISLNGFKESVFKQFLGSLNEPLMGKFSVFDKSGKVTRAVEGFIKSGDWVGR